jgi:hypothetical protein
MNGPHIEITERDRLNAQKCIECPMCDRARRKQRGLAFLFVKFLEKGICPYCKAYEKVYGKKAHEPRINDLKNRDQAKAEI